MSDIYDILTSLGYHLRDEGNFYRTSAVYRGGNNQSCMVIRKDNGSFKDFKTGKRGSFRDLIYLHGNEIGDELLKDYNPNAISIARPVVKIEKTLKYNRDELAKLMPKWDMYIADGISEKTMREFEVGFKENNQLFNRYCFPIYNEKEEIIGFSGRHYQKIVPENSGIAKWKHHGKKTEWLWPLHLNACEIAEKQEVILVESPNCVFHLWEAGVKNVICMFGIELNPKIFNFLIKERPKQIIIATNNDSISNNYAGQEAAQKIKDILINFFHPDKIKICFPTKKDFGEMNKFEIQQWIKSIPQIKYD